MYFIFKKKTIGNKEDIEIKSDLIYSIIFFFYIIEFVE